MTRNHHMHVTDIHIHRTQRGQHEMKLYLTGAWANDIPGVSKATLCNACSVAIKEPETTLLANHRQPKIDASKGTMSMAVAVACPVYNPDAPELERRAAEEEAKALNALREWCETALHNPDTEMVLSIDWADPVREPELFGGKS